MPPLLAKVGDGTFYKVDNGKLNLLGAFDTIYTQQLPAVHPQCSIALRLTFGHEDEGAH